MKKSFSDEYLISYMKDKAHELGRVPRISDFKSPSCRVYYKHFGNFATALLIAGLIDDIEHTKRGSVKKKYSKEELIDYLRQRKTELGRVPYEYELLDPTISHYKRAFGNYQNTLKEAGIEADYEALVREDMIEYLRHLYKKYNRMPNPKEMLKYKKIAYTRKFESWNEVLEMAHIGNPEERKNLQREDLIREFIKVYNRFGKIPNYSDLSNPTLVDYLLEFGTYEELLKACNIEHDMCLVNKGRPQYVKKYDKIFEYMKLKNVSLDDIKDLLGYTKTKHVYNHLERRGFSNKNLIKIVEYLGIE